MMKLHSLIFATLAAIQSIGQVYSEEVSSFYNPNETSGSFEWIMKPYPIPDEITTYTDFYFNIPDELPDLFHIVMGEVINSQPLHLHHFVLSGCAEKVDESMEGLAVEFDRNRNNLPSSCTIPIGAWAPGGNIFNNIDLDTGVLMGRGLGIQAVQLNVHYTDGVLENPETQAFKMATDGIRVHYTTDFRPYTSTTKPLINIGAATDMLVVPSGESRFFVTKTCEVNTSCKDASPEVLQQIASFLGVGAQAEELTCPGATAFCNMGGELGPYLQRLCPESCGYCGDGEGGVNPLNPGAYRITGVNYHAHLLGREMYTTLLREEQDSEITVKDMQSQPFWIYDLQQTFPFDFEDMVSSDGTAILRGTEVKPGDKIQSTCVFDASYRDKDTIFGASTYDEMCITQVLVSFETPDSLLNPNVNATDIDLRTELNLLTFTCDSGEETDVYTGVLMDGEEGGEIWKNHPISTAEGCTFPVNDYGFGIIGGGLFQTRNCPGFDENANVCQGLSEKVTLLDDENAGASCVGGTYATRDANDGLTEAQCLEGGGQWNPYTCSDINSWLQNEAPSSGLPSETVQYLVEFWWQPKCCSDESLSDSGAPGIAKGTITLALMTAMTVMIL